MESTHCSLWFLSVGMGKQNLTDGENISVNTIFFKSVYVQ